MDLVDVYWPNTMLHKRYVSLSCRGGHRQLYAIKEVDLHAMTKRQVDEAKNECEVLSQLHHPNVISYRDSFIQNKMMYIGTDGVN